MAVTTAHIPSTGVTGFAGELYRRFSNDRIMAISAGVTFYVLMAIFPAIAACVSLFGLFENFGEASADLSRLSALVPGGAIDIITEQIRNTIAHGSKALSLAAIFGFLFSLWSANSGVLSLFDALNIVRREPETRGMVTLYGRSLLFTFGLLLMAGVATGILIAISSWFDLTHAPLSVPIIAAGVAVLWVLLDLVIALLYRFGPAHNASWRWFTWGSVIAALAWLCVSALFSWYAANFGSFDKTYGSLGAAVGLMIWIWLSTVVVLSGEEINELIACHRGKTRAPSPLPDKA